MKCSRKLWLYIVAGMQILRAPIGVSAADSPCPDIFRYEGSPGNEYGIITVPSPYPYIAIEISVEIFITGPLPKVSHIKLQPVDTGMWRKVAAGSRDPIMYRLDFPVTSPLPTIEVITVNQHDICRGTTPYSIYVKAMTIEHAVIINHCQSASLQCPDNIKQSPERIPQPQAPQPPSPSSQTATGENISDSECGLPAVRTNALVFGGWHAQRGAWPWHVALYQNTGYDTLYRCGGSFVGTRTIITAANCFYTSAGERIPDEDFTVSLGRYNLREHKEVGVQDKNVSKVFIHPAFNLTSLKADIAIVTLSSTVQITAQVRPVCLWSANNTGLHSIVGRNGTVAGWGLDEKGMVAEKLKMVNMPVVSKRSCIFSGSNFFKTFVHETTFCAGLRDNNTVCNGDSGGGLMFRDDLPRGGWVWRLRGIVSSSKEDDFVGGRCDSQSYTIFTDVAPYLNWIESLLF